MKMIQAMIRPEQFESVKSALEKEGIIGLTAWETRGRGEQRGICLQFRRRLIQVDTLLKMMIEVAIQNEKIDRAIASIRSAARTGRHGDGKIFILPVERVVRVRTDEEWIEP